MKQTEQTFTIDASQKDLIQRQEIDRLIRFIKQQKQRRKTLTIVVSEAP